MSLFKYRKSRNLETKQEQPGQETEQKGTQFYNESKGFIQDMSKLLEDTVRQHHIVDSEHDAL